eukprot:SAG11_NODE_20484_length_444_cov_0.889855_1_plen_42_part_01
MCIIMSCAVGVHMNGAVWRGVARCGAVRCGVSAAYDRGACGT